MKIARLGLSLFIWCGVVGLALSGVRPAYADGPPICAKGDMCFCTGSPTGNYQKAAESIAKQLSQGLRARTRFINTNGSLDNLNYVAGGQCSVGITQSDVYDLWRTESSNANDVLPVQDLYTEYVHILCPAQYKNR